MSGTSADGIDAALVGVEPESQTLIPLAFHEHVIPRSIQLDISQFHEHDTHISLTQYAELDHKLGVLLAEACQELLKKTGEDRRTISAIGSHGQTVFHQPAKICPNTLQIGDPNVIAFLTGIPTIADFRRMDMAAGGQGAPLAPAFHRAYFHDASESRVFVNLGGIANVTWLAKDETVPVIGFDTGPANCLLDTWINQHLGKQYDHNGEWAASGTSNPALLKILLTDPYFQHAPPKSTGREYFNLSWLTSKLKVFGETISPRDVQATLLQLTVESVLCSIRSQNWPVDELILCGGGAYNKHLKTKFADAMGSAKLKTTADLGIEPDQVEAVAFAWLARQRWYGLPGNLPSVTGAIQHVCLGSIYQP